MVSFVVISKDEPLLDRTLTALAGELAVVDQPSEVVVVDASQGRLEATRGSHPEVRWIDFNPPSGVTVSIPHQRNAGVREASGEVIVFTDSGCQPQAGWARALLAPILAGQESATAGRTVGSGSIDMYDALGATPPRYVDVAPTINLAFTRAAFDAVGGFDESFAYGSDVDFSWRLRDHGYRIRTVPGAVVSADWGSGQRQLRRAWSYGRARARLYAKHRHRVAAAVRTDPVPFAYGLFLLALPCAWRFRAYPLLLVVPALRNRRTGPVLTVADHLLVGAGFLRGLVDR